MVRGKASSKRVVAVILGAGQGARTGYQVNKVFLPINGKPIIMYAVETFERCHAIDEIILVVAAGEEEHMMKLARHAQCTKVGWVIRGGPTRHESEQFALEVLRPHIDSGDVEIVLIDDTARPIVVAEKVEELYSRSRETYL